VLRLSHIAADVHTPSLGSDKKSSVLTINEGEFLGGSA
jgi:hypothetical protein